MKSTMTLSANLNVNPFEIFDQDTDEVITVINFYFALGHEQRNVETPRKTSAKAPASGAPQRIRVNDATATGGWF